MGYVRRMLLGLALDYVAVEGCVVWVLNSHPPPQAPYILGVRAALVRAQVR